MEPRFGADFSGVRVHTGGEAVQMNQELGAQAFTHGSDVYFGAGKSPGNNELTAHELTHVVQQTGVVQRQNKKSQNPTVPILEGVAPKNKVLSHLQSFEGTAGHDSSIYRKEILQFQRGNSADKIAASQQQVLESPKSVDIQQRANSSKIMRDCGCGGGTTPSPPTPTSTPLTFSSQSFNAGTGGAITATPQAGSVSIRSAAYSTSGQVKASGGTDVQAQDWEAGFIQTLKSTTRAAHYVGSPNQKTLSIVVATPIRDGNPAQNTSVPWYDSLNPSAKKAFTKTNSSVNVSLWDRPGTGAAWDTPDGQGKLDHYDGKDVFTAWMIVRQKTSPNTIQYMNWTSWEVDFSTSFNYASTGAKTVNNVTGQTANTGSGAGQGSDTPILSGPFPNSSARSVWS
jgi:hypothetical protein